MTTLEDNDDLFDDLGLFSGTDLAVGAPGEDTLKSCGEVIRRGHEYTCAQDTRSTIFQYGPRQGNANFRKALADFLSTEYGSKVNMKDLLVTSGASQGLYLLTSLLFKPGMPVFVEDPTFFVAIKILKEDLRMNVISVPMSKGSTNLELLEALLIENRQKYSDIKTTPQHPFWSMLYIVPTYCNPTGRCLSSEKCKAIVKLGRKYGVLIFSDDVYNLLHYGDGVPPQRLISYDDRSDVDFKGNVVSNGTFTKIFSPGIRLGWYEVPPNIMELLKGSGLLLSGGCVNHYISMVMYGAISLGLLTDYVNALRKQNCEKVKEVCDILQDNLPENVSFHRPMGGYFIWVELPIDRDAADLKELCVKKYNVSFAIGARCSAEAASKNCLRLCIAFYKQEVLYEAVKKVCQAIKDYL